MVEWHEQPDPLIDDYLEKLVLSGASRDQARIHELTLKLFEVHMLDKGKSVFETTPHYVKGYLYGILAHGATVTCLCRHWYCLREYFAFLVGKGMLRKNPATTLTYPRWGRERAYFIGRERLAYLQKIGNPPYRSIRKAKWPYV